MTAPGVLVAKEGWPASPRRRRGMLIGAAIVVALVLTAIVSFRWGSADSPRPLPTASREVAIEELSTAEIYAALAPSVVSIEAVRPGANKADATDTGTGVIANAGGIILTALHVVKGARSIRVTFADGTPSAATVVFADPTIDIAALEPDALPNLVVPAILGNSGRLSVGDGVIAIGNQLGLDWSATAGVVSGLNRTATGENGANLAGLIQFDAAPPRFCWRSTCRARCAQPTWRPTD
jgi:putative serine protease PepD